MTASNVSEDNIELFQQSAVGDISNGTEGADNECGSKQCSNVSTISLALVISIAFIVPLVVIFTINCCSSFRKTRCGNSFCFARCCQGTQNCCDVFVSAEEASTNGGAYTISGDVIKYESDWRSPPPPYVVALRMPKPDDVGKPFREEPNPTFVTACINCEVDNFSTISTNFNTATTSNEGEVVDSRLYFPQDDNPCSVCMSELPSYQEALRMIT